MAQRGLVSAAALLLEMRAATSRGCWPSTATWALSAWSWLSVSVAKMRASVGRTAGNLSSAAWPHHRRRLVNDLGALGILHHDEVERRDRAVGAVDHGGVDPADLLGRRAHGHGGVAARQDHDLVAGQIEAVGLLERGQGGRTLDELGRARELDHAGPPDDLGEIVHGAEPLAPGEVAAHRDQPGVVGGCAVEPDELVGLEIEPPHEFVGRLAPALQAGSFSREKKKAPLPVYSG